MSENTDLDQRVAQEVMGRFGAPAFMRRARLVETTWAHFVERGKTERMQLLAFVRLRLGQLYALAGTWDALFHCLQPEDVAQLQSLHAELQPRLLVPLQPTTSQRVLESALGELIEVMASFNRRWRKWLAGVDLQAINQAREAYNQFYLLEKECALGSARVAGLGFQRLAAITPADVERELPPLRVPRRA